MGVFLLFCMSYTFSITCTFLLINKFTFNQKSFVFHFISHTKKILKRIVSCYNIIHHNSRILYNCYKKLVSIVYCLGCFCRRLIMIVKKVEVTLFLQYLLKLCQQVMIFQRLLHFFVFVASGVLI